MRPAKLRSIDVKVLEGLALYGPRNNSKTAEKLKMPRESLTYRIRHLRSHFSLYTQGNVYHTNIGLRKIFLIAKAKLGCEDVLYKCLKANNYWLYATQCVGTPTCVATYGIPAGKEKEFEEFTSELRSLKLTDNITAFWSTSIHNVNVTSTWFDSESGQWTFPWESWFQEIVQSRGGDLPYTIMEPNSYTQMADFTDIFILKELEKDSSIKLNTIARKLGISLQLLRYHYRTHVLEKQMFEGPQILADHFKGLMPQRMLFMFSFGSYDSFKKFALALMDKPFVRDVGKFFGENRLFAHLYLPVEQLGNFTKTLSRLARNGSLESYEYVTEDTSTTQRQTISYEFFKNKTWEYDHAKYLEQVRKAAEAS